VGSQLSLVKEVFNGTPSTPSGYSIANEQVSNVDGIPTRQFTFLKNNVTLSETEDKVGGQLAIVKEVFNGTPSTPSGYSIASEQESNVDGISTKRFTFLKNNVQLSQSEDKVGSQLSISQQWFNPSSDKTVSGYSLASQNTSDFEGIKTIEYRFLKEDVQLSQSEDEVGSQNSITEEWFKPSASRKIKTTYSLARKEESNVQGIPTERYTFLKDNVELSRTEDKVGSQLSIITEVFNPASDPTESGYSVARTEVSEVDGIPTKRFTFLKDDVQLSESEDKVGSQLAITEEWFKPASTRKAKTNYSLARTEESNVDGIPTERYTFLKDDVQISQSEDEVGSQNGIIEEWFKPAASRKIKANYSLARKEESDIGGIPTERYTFLKNNVALSVSEDKVGSQLAITEEWFNPSASRKTKSLYSLAREEESDVDGIPTERYTFLKDDVKLSNSIDNVGSQKAVIEQWFKPSLVATSGAVNRSVKTGYSLAKEAASDFEGIPTRSFTFLKNNVILSISEDRIGSQLSVTNQVFKPTSDTIVGKDVSGTALSGYSEASREKSDFAGIPTISYVFLKDNVQLSESTDNVGSEKAITEQWFKPTAARKLKTNYSLAKEDASDVDGIPTERYTFLKDDVQLSETEDNVGSQLAITEQWFKPAASRKAKSNYSLAKEDISDVDGIPTERYMFLKNNVVLSVSQDRVGSQLAVTNEVFKPTNDAFAGVDVANVALSGYQEADRRKSDFAGIPTIQYRFLKADVQLSQSEDEVGSQNSINEEWFKPSASRKTKTNYSLARKEESNVNGIPTERYTFLKNNVVLSETEDKVGSQLAIVKEVFNGTPVTPSGYSIASEQESDVDGIPTKRYTFLKEDVQLSDSEDEVGSQNSITEEWFKPAASRKTKSNYSLARKDQSDIGGIPTERYTFLENDVKLSDSTDNVGSQKAIVEEWFNPASSRKTKSSYSLAKEEISNVEGIPTERYTFLKPSILSVQRELNSGFRKISVRAFDLTDGDVRGILTSNPPQATDTLPNGSSIVSEETSDFDGIKTRVFNFEFHEVFTESYDLNGLKRIEQRTFSTSDFTAGVIGGVAGTAASAANTVPAGSPVIGLYLSAEEIDNGGDIKTKVSNWIEAGTLSVSKNNESEGVIKVTTTFLATEGSTVGPVIERTTGKFEGLKTIAVTTLQDDSGQSIVHSNSNTVHKYNRMVDFTYPGVVSLGGDVIDPSGVNNPNINFYNFHLKPPVQAKVEARVTVIFQTSADIVAGDFTFNDGDAGGAATGLYNPTSWARTYESGIAHNFSPFSVTRGLRGYRIDTTILGVTPSNGSGNNITRTFTSNGVIVFTSKRPSFVQKSSVTTAGSLKATISGVADGDGLEVVANGRRMYGNEPFILEISGGPSNPANSKLTLDVDLRPAFSDINGNTYYKKTILTALIPTP
jgi:hypothetical protein